MNRLSIRYQFPPCYKQADFQDIIDILINQTKMRVEDGYIQMGIYRNEKEFERFGKKFKIFLIAFLGQIYITIEEQNNVPPL